MPKKNHEKLHNLRHTAAHILAHAVLNLYGPKVKFGIGPVIESGFYYDFDFPKPISDEDLPKIEKEMRRLIKQNLKMKKEAHTFVAAKKLFKGQPYKLELLQGIAKGKASFYRIGNFLDLCRGGHVKNSKEIPADAFKLTHLAGAYWKGSEKNPMLTRIYGAAFATKKQLDKFLQMQEEAKRRDHKVLGEKLELFTFSQSVGPGLPLLLPKGYRLRKVIEDYLYEVKNRFGLTFVWSPHIARSELYVQSKHWQKYEAMMPPLKLEGEEYALKPMNCPHHFHVYLAKPRSYRDLPLRIAENGTVYRYEKSGVLNGLLRVRAITQDDSHWFVPPELLAEEIDRAIKLTESIYQDFGLKNYIAQISLRDPNHPKQYLGDSKVWNQAEKQLIRSVKKQKIAFTLRKGEAAFYGPKIDFMVKDALGREWQLTTIQLDFNQPENFDLIYTDKDGKPKRPAVLHIAILGSLERFIGILIEHFAGAFPLWLAPVQIAILPISDELNKYAQEIAKELTLTLSLSKRGGAPSFTKEGVGGSSGLRIEIDSRSESIGKKIREAELQKIPYMLIVGKKEKVQKTVSVRQRGERDLGETKLEKFVNQIRREIETKSL